MSIEALEDFAKAGPHKYKSRKKVKGKWVYEYDEPKKQKTAPGQLTLDLTAKPKEEKKPTQVSTISSKKKDRPDYDITTGEGQKRMFYDVQEERMGVFRGGSKPVELKKPGETGSDPILDEKGNPTGRVKMHPTGRIVEVSTGKTIQEAQEKPKEEKKEPVKTKEQDQKEKNKTALERFQTSVIDLMHKNPDKKFTAADMAGKLGTGWGVTQKVINTLIYTAEVKPHRTFGGRESYSLTPRGKERVQDKKEEIKPKEKKQKAEPEKAQFTAKQKDRAFDLVAKAPKKQGYMRSEDIADKMGLSGTDAIDLAIELKNEGLIQSVEGMTTVAYRLTMKGKEVAGEKATAKKEKKQKAVKATPTGTKEAPLQAVPKDTDIKDTRGMAFSKWEGKLALVTGPDDYERRNPTEYTFNPETMSHKYHVRHAIDHTTKKPIPAHDKHLGREPNLGNRRAKYEDTYFQVGGDTSWSPGASGTFDKGKEVWVQSKVKDLSPTERNMVQEHLEAKGYKEPRPAKLSAANWKRALGMSYTEIQAGKDTEMANAVERFLDYMGKDTNVDERGNASWASIPGILLTDRYGRLKTIIDKKDLKKSMEGQEMSGIEQLEDFGKGGPYIGPKGGKYSDPQHKIPWKEGAEKEGGKGSAEDEKIKSLVLGKLGEHAALNPMLSKYSDETNAKIKSTLDSLISSGHVKTKKTQTMTGSTTGYVLTAKGAKAQKMKKSMEERTMNGIDELKDFVKGNGAMPSGEPCMGQGEKEGGPLAGKGKTSGSGDSAAGPPIAAPAPGKDKFSEDDEDEKKAMKEHKKPLEKTAKSFRDTTPQGQRDAVAHEHARLVSRLQKGPEMVQVGVPGRKPERESPELVKSRQWVQHKESCVVYTSGGIDDMASEMVKSESFYHGGAPSMTPQVALHQSKECPECGDRMSKALTACPYCGHGTAPMGVFYTAGE